MCVVLCMCIPLAVKKCKFVYISYRNEENSILQIVSEYSFAIHFAALLCDLSNHFKADPFCAKAEIE